MVYSEDVKQAKLEQLAKRGGAFGVGKSASASDCHMGQTPMGIRGQWSDCDVYCGHGRRTRLHEIMSCNQHTHFVPYMMTLKEHKACNAGPDCPPGAKPNQLNPDVAVPKP
jgi:hypothetical protein